MEHWASGYTPSELAAAQERYELAFPPDLIELFLIKRPAEGYDWRNEDSRIRKMLHWPFEMLQFDIEENGLWWPEWGAKPIAAEDRASVLRAELAKAPKLIPLFSHRFIPETPHQAGNPIFSMHGSDTIYYGANLDQYFDNEFTGRHVIGPVTRIPFWSDLVDRN